MNEWLSKNTHKQNKNKNHPKTPQNSNWEWQHRFLITPTESKFSEEKPRNLYLTSILQMSLNSPLWGTLP